jgi:hypothetical protein
MIKWYKDDNIGIYFDDTPHPCVRYPLPSMTDKEKEMIRKYPFVNRKDLRVQLEDCEREKTYKFTIPKGYTWDGASIPRIFWRLIGAKTDSAFLIPSMIHDVLCENHNYVNDDRYFADRVFEKLLKVSGVSSFNRWLMFHSVDNWQKFCKWSEQK